MNDTKMPRVRPHRKDVPDGECLCDYCSAKCCRYFTLSIDEPQTRADFDLIRWYLLHESATVFVEDGGWFLLMHTVCKKLGSENRCMDYENRPNICREYTTEECEYDDDYTYEQYFERAEQLAEYMDAVFSKPTGPEFRSPRPTNALPVLH